MLSGFCHYIHVSALFYSDCWLHLQQVTLGISGEIAGSSKPTCLSLEVKRKRNFLFHSLSLAFPALSLSFSPSWKALDGSAQSRVQHSDQKFQEPGLSPVATPVPQRKAGPGIGRPLHHETGRQLPVESKLPGKRPQQVNKL